MLANKVIELENAVSSEVKKENFELEYIEEVKENGRDILRVVIDRENYNLTTEDCENVSRAIEDIIDSKMKNKEYVLEVSSAGLEKNLKNIRLYEKYISKMAFVRLFKKTKLTSALNEKEFEAEIIKVDKENEKVTFKDLNGEEFEIILKDIASAHTVFDYDAFFKNV